MNAKEVVYVHDGILLSNMKNMKIWKRTRQYQLLGTNTHGPGCNHTVWWQSKRKKRQMSLICGIWKLMPMNQLKKRNRFTKFENKIIVPKRETWGDKLAGGINKSTAIHLEQVVTRTCWRGREAYTRFCSNPYYKEKNLRINRYI